MREFTISMPKSMLMVMVSGREIPDKHICYELQILSGLTGLQSFWAIPKGQWSSS